MQEDFSAVAEKIITDIHQIFIKHRKVISFEIIPATQSQNKSPIHFEQHCLGLESWCIRHVYCYAHKFLLNIRVTEGKIKDVEKCNSHLIGALLLNPSNTTMWNMRKELLLSEQLDPSFDLKLTAVILTYKPKCADIYAFRKWILKTLIPNFSTNNKLMENEFAICDAASSRYSNNYHAWTHRYWCLSQISPALLQKEWSTSVKWIERHVSDYSGFHYRQKLITCIRDYIGSSSFDPELLKAIACSGDKATERFLRDAKKSELTVPTIPFMVKIMIYELCMNTDLIFEFYGHEALWCHRRFVLHELKRALFNSDDFELPWGYFDNSNHPTSEGVPPEKTLKISRDNILDQFSLILSFYEDDFLIKCYEEAKPRLNSNAIRHKDWLTRFSLFQLPPTTDNGNR